MKISGWGCLRSAPHCAATKVWVGTLGTQPYHQGGDGKPTQLEAAAGDVPPQWALCCLPSGPLHRPLALCYPEVHLHDPLCVRTTCFLVCLPFWTLLLTVQDPRGSYFYWWHKGVDAKPEEGLLCTCQTRLEGQALWRSGQRIPIIELGGKRKGC